LLKLAFSITTYTLYKIMSELLAGNTKLRIAALASLAGTGALLAAGCGGSGSAKTAIEQQPGLQTCIPKDPVGWESTPPNVRMKLVAGILKVSRHQVVDGSIGMADCRQPVSVDPLGQEIVSITGYGERCLPIATTDESGKYLPHDKSSRHILAICAADAPSL